MRDKEDVILYVGKAVNLHNRVLILFSGKYRRGPAIEPDGLSDRKI